MKLTELKGAECLPQLDKSPFNNTAREQVIDALHSIQLSVDVEAFAKILMDKFDEDYCWDNISHGAEIRREVWLKQAKTIANNLSSILYICPADKKGK